MENETASRKTGSGDPNEAPEPVSQLASPFQHRKIIHVIVVDVLILVELGIAVTMADSWRAEADFTLVFCAIVFGLVIPTIYVSRRIARRHFPAEPEEPDNRVRGPFSPDE